MPPDPRFSSQRVALGLFDVFCFSLGFGEGGFPRGLSLGPRFSTFPWAVAPAGRLKCVTSGTRRGQSGTGKTAKGQGPTGQGAKGQRAKGREQRAKLHKTKRSKRGKGTTCVRFFFFLVKTHRCWRTQCVAAAQVPPHALSRSASPACWLHPRRHSHLRTSPH